uniref:Uncharacterized protein n=1 Tax=Panagrolaimus superbus TaxID=310955 RepID=A0A914YN59_9BILA
MITNLTAACVDAVRSYSLETLNNEKSFTSPSKVTVSSVRRGGSLKNPLPKAVFSKKNRLSTPPNQIYSIGDKDEENDDTPDNSKVIDESDLPPENSPPPPPINEEVDNEKLCDENTPIRHYHQHRHPSILRAIDDLELRESASCNF